MKTSILFSILFAIAVQLRSNQYYVSVNGNSLNSGSINSPWSLKHALSHPSSILAGDTVWLRGGIYLGQFNCNLQGSQGLPITLRNYNNERAVIKDTFHIGGSSNTFNVLKDYVNIWGLEFTADSTTAPHYSVKIYYGNNIKLINCIVHNSTSVGIGISAPARSVEVYGCLVFDNGYQGDVTSGDTGHGHGMYIQNNPDRNFPRIIKNNFIFNNQKVGLNFFSETEKQSDAIIKDNVLFNGGAMLDTTISIGTYTAQVLRNYNLVIGGNTNGVARVNFFDNICFRDLNGKNVLFGYSNKDSSINIAGNHFINIIGNNHSVSSLKPYNGYGPIVIRDWKTALTFTNNKVYTPRVGYGIDWDLQNSFSQASSLIPSYTWNYNSYYKINTIFGNSISNWKQTYGKDINSSTSNSAPVNNYIKIIPNQYEPNKLYVTIVNWQLLNTVQQNFDSYIPNGTTYKIYDIQNIFSSPITTGTYSTGGNISFNMTLNQVAPAPNSPQRNLFSLPKHTSKYMGTFIIELNTPILTSKNEMTESGVQIFPNPTSDKVYISLKESYNQQNFAVVLNDLYGKQVLSKIINYDGSLCEFAINNLNQGIYYLTITNEAGYIIAKQRLSIIK